ncbi:MAG: hypothetical protein N3E47_04335 [Candidatus Bathyarchaeota archaeon]|nr:hypothetical protein [Candidatus Bathyarchaeota archaeon]
MMGRELLGVYSGFPERCHQVSFLEVHAPIQDIQRAVVNALYGLNGRSVGDYWSRSVGADIDVIFEFGVAEDLTFHYINSDTLNLLLKAIGERVFRLLDFISIIRYYVKSADVNGKRKPLRFDYYFLRFIFGGRERYLEIRVFHEKGPQRVSPREMVEFLAENIILAHRRDRC